MDNDQPPPSNQEDLHEELVAAGFPEDEIYKAFQWLDELALQRDSGGLRPQTENSIRIYTEQEIAKMDYNCRGLLLFLEQNNILDQANREFVIERTMALDSPVIKVDDLKWVVLMVLMNQPGQETAFAQMEDLVYNDQPLYLH
jgi:Smg protein